MKAGNTRSPASERPPVKCPSCRLQHVDVVLTFHDNQTIEIARCKDCKGMIVIVDGVTVYAGGPMVDEPCEGMPADAEEAYREACKVVNVSPRAAYMLLEPHVHSLCDAAGAEGETLAEKVRWLCDNGHLPAEIASGFGAESGDGRDAEEEEIEKARNDAYALMRIGNFLGNVHMPQYGTY